MKVIVESDGSYISLKAYKEHYTLYKCDLENFIGDTAEETYSRINNYLLDVLPDDGHPDWTWDNNDLKKACHKVFKRYKK